MSYYSRFLSFKDVYEQSYGLLREFWDPGNKALRYGRKISLRELQGNNPEAYRAAFLHFWANKREMRQRALLKDIRQKAQQEIRDLGLPKYSEVSLTPAPFTEEHVRQWLIEKDLIPKNARI